MQMRAILGIVVLVVFDHQLEAAPFYSIQDLGVAGRHAMAVDINNSGQIVLAVLPEGAATTPEVPGESYLMENGGRIALGSLGGSRTVLASINDSGVIVGLADSPSGELRSTRVVNGQIEDLSVFGDVPSGAIGINNAGDIVGLAYHAKGHRAYLRKSNGETIDLGTFGGDVSSASDINDSGQIVGSARPEGDGTSFAFLYQNDVMESLGTLGGGASYAGAINQHGVIVGESNRADGIVRAFLYDSVSGMRDIGTGEFMSSASDINNNNIVVGAAEPKPGDLRAFVYDEPSGMRFLDQLIPSNSGWEKLFQAGAVNDAGFIVGLGRIDGEIHAFLATPIPEPSSLALLVLGTISFVTIFIHRALRNGLNRWY